MSFEVGSAVSVHLKRIFDGLFSAFRTKKQQL